MTVKKENLISMKEYAKRRKVSYELIRRYCKKLPVKITLIDGMIDPVSADRELADNVQINGNAKLAKTPRQAAESNHTLDFNKAKARREISKADLAELEYKERAGLFIEVSKVAKEAEDLYRQFRDQMLNVVIRATKKLLGETDEFKFRRILKEEIESAIKKIE